MRDRLLSLGLAVLALLMFAGLFIEPEEKIISTLPSTDDKGEQGVAAFFQWLKSRDVAVQSFRRRWFDLPDRFPIGHVLVTQPSYDMQEEKSLKWMPAPRGYIDSREQRAIVRWVSAGNSLVMPMSLVDLNRPEYFDRSSDRSSLASDSVLRHFGWQMRQLRGEPEPAFVSDEDSDLETDVANAKGVSNGQKALAVPVRLEDKLLEPPDHPQALHRLRLQLPGLQALALEARAWQPADQEHWAPDALRDERRACLGIEQSDDDDSEYDENSDPSEKDDEPTLPTEPPLPDSDFSKDIITSSGDTYAPDELECMPSGLNRWVPILLDADSRVPHGWWLPFGRGRLVVLNYGALFRNSALSQAQNAQAGEALLRWAALPGGTILFDDYRYGLSEIIDPENFFKDVRLYITLGIALLFWLLYVVGRSARMLPVRPQAARPSTARFAQMVSHFFARKLSPADTALALIAHFLQRARRQLGCADDAPTIWQRLRQHPRLDAGLIENIQSLANGRDNLRLVELIHQLETKLSSQPGAAIRSAGQIQSTPFNQPL